MYYLLTLALLCAALTTACIIPPDILSNNITDGFGILIQNPTYPVIHDRYMNLMPAGGGDEHLFLDPVGNPTFNLVLGQGILEQDIIHAVIDGEYSEVDNTTKMFMTERGDPKAIFTPVYGCDPDTDELQIQLLFQTREESPVGGLICVRIASGNRGYEFRYSPPDNPAFDPTNPCMPVTMVVVSGSTSVSTPTSSGTSPSTSGITLTTLITLTTSTTSSALSTPTGPLQPSTVNGIWTWYGCQTEATNTRALNAATYADDAMTLESCATFCDEYTYFGTEYARECYCGNSFNAGSVSAPATDCIFICKGNSLELCGAGLRLSVYTKNGVSQSSSSSTSSTTSSSSSMIPSSSPTGTSASTGSSVLPTTTSGSSTSTTDIASTTSSTSSSNPLPYTDMTAEGFAYLGCAPEERRATDGPGRTLTGPLYADDAMTDGKCMAYCSSQGYTYAGTEYTRECWCGNSVAPGRVPQTTIASLAGCNMLCGGDATQYCGGDAWLSLYEACAAGSACVNAQFT